MSKDKEKQRKFPIRVDLDNEDEEKFIYVQDKFRLKNKAEVLRFCVNKVYHGTALEIDEDLYKEIDKVISSYYIRIKYGITSVDDFIKRAVTDFLETLKKERSLRNWSMRQSLSEEENDTAVALLDLQRKNIPGVTIEDLEEYLNGDRSKIGQHLEKFVGEALLEFRESRGKIYYHAP
ncbi:MAG: hypothetical protein ACFFD4_06435 [Candidatus Odinarchaeota archaeon]